MIRILHFADLHLGEAEARMETAMEFLASMRIAFAVFAALSLVGIFVSLASRRNPEVPLLPRP